MPVDHQGIKKLASPYAATIADHWQETLDCPTKWKKRRRLSAMCLGLAGHAERKNWTWDELIEVLCKTG